MACVSTTVFAPVGAVDGLVWLHAEIRNTSHPTKNALNRSLDVRGIFSILSGRWADRQDEHLVHPVSIHIHHLKAQILPFKFVAHSRHPP